MRRFYEIRFLVAFLLAVPLESISVNPSLCPTNKIAPHKRIANWEYGTGRTFGAFYDLLAPGPGYPPYDAPNYQNDLQEKPQEDDPNDCGEIEDYDENDLSSITSQGNRRRDNRGFDIRSIFGSSEDYPNRPPIYPERPNRPERPPNRPERPPNRPERPPNRPERPPNRPERPPNRPERPPRPPNRPQKPPNRPEKPPYRPENPSFPGFPTKPTTSRPERPTGMRPSYGSGGYFEANVYRPPLQQEPSDNYKPIHEYTESQMMYTPGIVGAPLYHVIGATQKRPGGGYHQMTTSTTPKPSYDHFRSNDNYPTRAPRARNLNDNVLGSFVDLLF